jgi:ferredoxin
MDDMKNRVYFFTGTGNSLHLTQMLVARLVDCEIAAIHKGADLTVPSNLDRVGFVFPVYFWGLPGMVANFLRNAEFPVQGDTYCFAIATFGAIIGNALPQVKRLLNAKGVTLNYGGGVRSFANAVVFYEMKEDVEKITRIELSNSKPAFDNHCEYCLACIQHCPKRAINDGDKTQSRRRYTHPNIGYKTIAQYYQRNE